MEIKQPQKSVDELITILGYNNEKDVKAATQALLRLKGNKIVPALLTALSSSSNIQVRCHAAHLLGEIRLSRNEPSFKQQVVNVLIQALLDKEDVVRINTLMALSKQGDRNASQEILSLLVVETSPLLSFVEVQTIRDIGVIHPDYLSLLVLTMLVIINDESRWPATREGAENTLIHFGTKCLPHLKKLMKHDDPLISSQANILFKKISKEMTQKKRKTKCKNTVVNSKQT